MTIPRTSNNNDSDIALEYAQRFAEGEKLSTSLALRLAQTIGRGIDLVEARRRSDSRRLSERAVESRRRAPPCPLLAAKGIEDQRQPYECSPFLSVRFAHHFCPSSSLV
jgi:hypothetical protein